MRRAEKRNRIPLRRDMKMAEYTLRFSALLPSRNQRGQYGIEALAAGGSGGEALIIQRQKAALDKARQRRPK